MNVLTYAFSLEETDTETVSW